MQWLTDYLDPLVFGLLGCLSLIMLTLSIERFLFYRTVRLQEFKHLALLQIELSKHLTLIASIASNAPYIGLLGTVFGILITFHKIGTSGNVEVGEIMIGLAMALKATAAGLCVAIPAMMFYNALSRKTETLTAQWQAKHPSEAQQSASTAL